MKKNINTPILEMINVSKSFKISKSLLQPKEYLMALLNIVVLAVMDLINKLTLM